MDIMGQSVFLLTDIMQQAGLSEIGSSFAILNHWYGLFCFEDFLQVLAEKNPCFHLYQPFNLHVAASILRTNRPDN
jgi:hypothetical protein